MSGPPAPRVPARRRRDRRGRGLRGALVPGTTGSDALDERFRLPPAPPRARTRAEGFDDLVLDAVEHLEERWAEQLAGVEFAVEEVPPVTAPPAAADAEPGGADGGLGGLGGLAVPPDPDDGWRDDPVPLARLVPATPGRGGHPPRVVLYRRPIEARSLDEADRADLVLDVVVHEVARLLGRTPEEIDPEGHGDPDDDLG